MRCGTLFLCGTVLACSLVAAQEPYKFSKEILIGGEGGWDILTIDAAARRLYLSHGTKVVVVDIDEHKVVGEIDNTPGVHTFLPVPDLERGFSSNGKEDKCSVVDLRTLQTITKLDTGKSPDSIAYDPTHSEVYVFNHSGNSVTVIDAKALTITATIALEGSPEFGVVDPGAGRIYCNIEDKSEVAVIDTAKHQVIAYWPLSPGNEPTGIALDTAHHRLFSTCRKIMTMLDTTSGKMVASVPIAKGADGCAFDEIKQLAFASCGEGATIIVKEETPDTIRVVQTLTTERGARTISLDPKTRRIFLPTAKFKPAPSPSPGGPPMRPQIIPDTLKLLIYSPTGSS